MTEKNKDDKGMARHGINSLSSQSESKNKSSLFFWGKNILMHLPVLLLANQVFLSRTKMQKE
ncbi:hypothetical protein NLC35_03720 [Candidatus Aminicenantes bacterium AC-334-K16]|nr:hypothetical protein [Candidatus Aminicenantes bacterium AC-334-K16]